MIGEQYHLGALGDRGLQAVARPGVGIVGRERLAARELDQLGHDRAAPGHDERLGPQHVEDARAREREHRLLHRLDPLLEPHHERTGRRFAARQLPEPPDERRRVRDVVGGDEIHGNSDSRELCEGVLACPFRGGDHEIGLEGDDRLEARRDHPADLRLSLGLRWKVAEVGHADQQGLGAQRVEDLGDTRHERDDALGRRRERDVAAEHVACRERRGRRRIDDNPRRYRHRREHDDRDTPGHRGCSSAGFAGAVSLSGEASVGAAEAPSA